MIFIVIAVAILFISFIVALFSLVREQKKIEKVEESGVDEQAVVQPSIQQSPTVESAATDKQEPIVADTDVKEHILEPQKPLVEHEDRFSWETEHSVPSSHNSEQDEIEKIRAEIARMQKPSVGQEDETIVSQEHTEAKEDLDDTRLTGEFQIRRDN